MRGWFRGGALALALAALTQGIPVDRGEPSLRQTLQDRAAQSAAPLDIKAVENVVTESQHAGVPNTYALELASTVDDNGKPVFSPTAIAQLHEHDVPTATAIELNAICDAQGTRILDTDGITALIHTGKVGDFKRFWQGEEGKRYAAWYEGLKDIAGRPSLTPWDIYRARVLNLSSIELGEFIDTDAPNALVVMPRNDYNGAFLSDTYQRLLQRIYRHYDCHVVFADREYQVQAALTDMPDISLVLLTGHGSPCSLALGKGFGEAGNIDCTDDELQKPLRNLTSDATIILYSCSTGSGADTGKNLANKISGMRRSIEVLAPTDLLCNIELNPGFPGDLILKNLAGNDVTYCVR